MNANTKNSKEPAVNPHALAASIRVHAQALIEQAERLEASLVTDGRALRTRGTRELAPVVEAKPKRQIDPARPFFVGDDATTPELIAVVQSCIERPRTLREIVELTGCTNRNRVSGAIVKLQVAHPGSVKNIGDARRALWWMPTKKNAYSSKTER